MGKTEDGCFINGLYLEGAGQDAQNGVLTDSKSRELQTPLPILKLSPTDAKEPKSQNNYVCPLYKTTARSGVLTTTGHSSNFVINIDIDSKEESDKWILAGVAAFLSLKD